MLNTYMLCGIRDEALPCGFHYIISVVFIRLSAGILELRWDLGLNGHSLMKCEVCNPPYQCFGSLQHQAICYLSVLAVLQLPVSGQQNYCPSQVVTSNFDVMERVGRRP